MRETTVLQEEEQDLLYEAKKHIEDAGQKLAESILHIESMMNHLQEENLYMEEKRQINERKIKEMKKKATEVQSLMRMMPDGRTKEMNNYGY